MDRDGVNQTIDVHCARHRVVLTGAVQGVGMRPFVYRLAEGLGLAGFVANDGVGAVIEVEGPHAAIAEFERRLVDDAPPLARIAEMRSNAVAATGEPAFRIAASAASASAARINGRTTISPDTATCDACLSEIRDPADRRYRHPFANCTDCGPRFTIIRDLPYDRPMTTMARFALCADCAVEYGDPRNRRYHAQPISCPRCGPQLTFARGADAVSGTDAAIAAVQAAWAAGEVVAVKGIGGYHLTCDAADDDAVARLRARKGRVGKPLAVMVRDVADAEALVSLDGAGRRALSSAARPIVLAARRPDAAVSVAVAPGNSDLGIMLAYSGIHELLLTPVPGTESAPPRVIVATSGNRANEPICTDDADARARLGDLADAFLGHDREIHVACDDSVVRITAGGEQPIRRSRGYAPLPVDLPVRVPPTLAVGGELKSTFCLAAGEHAWMSQHIGDLENLETLDALERSAAAFQTMYRIVPEVVAVDAHPGYLSRRWAYDRFADRAAIVEVQHHHAHIAALMAEHGCDSGAPLIGIAFDGTGYGPAAAGGPAAGGGPAAAGGPAAGRPAAGGGGPAIWGGEVLIADYAGYERAGHLAELPLPGGDAAVRNPWRVAVAFVAACGLELDPASPPVRHAGSRARAIVEQQVRTGIGVVPTTSMGRLFDAVASLLGVCHEITYEAQAAIELEAVARAASSPSALSFEITDDGVIDPAPLLGDLLAARARGVAPSALALGFHEAVADAAARCAERAARTVGVRTVGLSGGVFQNALLSRLCRERLVSRGLAVLEHRTVPANDGGLALGQAVVAAHRSSNERGRWNACA
jgi:hydrogenase maturation protein HypF